MIPNVTMTDSCFICLTILTWIIISNNDNTVFSPYSKEKNMLSWNKTANQNHERSYHRRR